MQGKSVFYRSLVSLSESATTLAVTCIALLLPLLYPSTVFAGRPSINTENLAPGFTTTNTVSILHEDNIRRNTKEKEQTDTLLTVNPELQWLALFGKHRVTLNYDGDFGFYSDENKLNYNDHDVNIHGAFDHNYRISTQFELGYQKDHDDPGSTNAIVLDTGKFNLFNNKQSAGTFFYGRQKSQGQLALRVQHNQLTYTNNEQQYRDHNRDTVAATFFYRVAPKTRLLVESAFTEYDYQNSDRFDQSSEDTRYLLGFEWRGTSKTTGIFKVGHQDKDYNSGELNDISGLTLSLDMIWKPNTYTTIKIEATRDTEESAQAFTRGFVSEYLNADLKHWLTPRTSITARMGYGDEKYANTLDRNDKRKQVHLGIEHDLRRWLTLGSELQYEARDSNNALYSYAANTAVVYINASFD